MGFDLLRWGQDGLALRSYGWFGDTTAPQVLLIRGPFVAPLEMTSNNTAELTGASQTTITAGSVNIALTLNGSGFMPGAMALWNDKPRTASYGAQLP